MFLQWDVRAPKDNFNIYNVSSAISFIREVVIYRKFTWIFDSNMACVFSPYIPSREGTHFGSGLDMSGFACVTGY